MLALFLDIETEGVSRPVSYKLKRGYFSDVNGAAVTRQPLPLSLTTWKEGFPTGILFHYTVGCNDDIAPTLRSKNFGATFNVGRKGGIFQYRPLLKPSWHAYDASRYYLGIEHTSLGPGPACELTDKQLEASAKLSAAIVEWAYKRYEFVIPLVKTDGPALIPGFKDHADGTKDTWNPNVHVDRLFNWTWSRYLGRVQQFVFPYSVYSTRDGDRRAYDSRTLVDAAEWGLGQVEKGWRVTFRKWD